MRKTNFSDILNDVKSNPINFPFFNAFVAKQFILFIDDRLVKFGRARSEQEFHGNKRPAAVMNKELSRALFIPGSSKRNSSRYTVYAAADEISGLHKNGWFLIRYYQNEQAGFFEQGGGCMPGSKIPDKIFNEMQEKLNAFIDGQAG